MQVFDENINASSPPIQATTVCSTLSGAENGACINNLNLIAISRNSWMGILLALEKLMFCELIKHLYYI